MEHGAARWRMLAILFIARTAMAFQFQMVGAISPMFVATYGVGNKPPIEFANRSVAYGPP